jgi:UDP-N-acetylglucosamine--N-acetylmuramyl-(pentapeptide) pyrophosphoryl-undecaprenol N-acetylglucosamine transferase
MKIVLAGGGTAGHIEPALAVARMWRESHPSDQLLFLGTKSGLENQLIPAAGFELSLIPKVIIPRKVSLSLFFAPTTLTRAYLEARRYLTGANLLIGFGGYVSAPAYLAARSLKIPIVIHEANAKPGLANRLGALLTNYLAIAMPIERGKLSNALMTGLPLRADVAQSLRDSAPDWAQARIKAKESLGLDVNRPVVTIFFGSQGSVALNKVIASAMKTFTNSSIQVIHALGKSNPIPPANGAYRPLAYIEDMARTYLASELIISRSGAVTCSEVNALGRYTLFIPLPIGNGEQKVNAQSVVSQLRGELIEQNQFTPEWLDKNIDRLLQNSQMAPIAGNPSDLQATEKIVALMESALVKETI